MTDWRNKLYYGDNLDILRKHIADESVDLIYLDPPFNSKATYNVLFKEKSGEKSPAQIKAFEDTWEWDQVAAETYHEIVTQGPPDVAQVVGALHSFLVKGTRRQGNDLMAYLVLDHADD